MLTVVTTMDGIADRLIPVERFKEAVITLDYSSEIEPEKLAKKLVAMGFVRTGMVEDKGQFAIRGGIIDIFSYTDEAPVRIELWDTEVDSIRMFDVESQRSIERLQSYSIFPATEYIFTEDELKMVCTILRKSVTGSLSVLIMVRESVQRSRLRRVIILTSLLQMSSVPVIMRSSQIHLWQIQLDWQSIFQRRILLLC